MADDTPKNTNLTSAQEHALGIYRKLCDKHGGESPTVREFAAALGKTHTTAHQYIQQFRAKGYLSMKPVTIIRPKLTAKGRAAK